MVCPIMALRLEWYGRPRGEVNELGQASATHKKNGGDDESRTRDLCRDSRHTRIISDLRSQRGLPVAEILGLKIENDLDDCTRLCIIEKLAVALLSSRPNSPFLLLSCTEVGNRGTDGTFPHLLRGK